MTFQLFSKLPVRFNLPSNKAAQILNNIFLLDDFLLIVQYLFISLMLNLFEKIKLRKHELVFFFELLHDGLETRPRIPVHFVSDSDFHFSHFVLVVLL
jgi:hypothetical protein